MAQLILVRGHPGSGKSTFAAELALRIGSRHFENDDFFIGADGGYRFDPGRHAEAKDDCLQRTKEALEAGERIVVAATFTTLAELRPYEELNVSFRVVEMGYVASTVAQEVCPRPCDAASCFRDPHLSTLCSTGPAEGSPQASTGSKPSRSWRPKPSTRPLNFSSNLIDRH